MIIKLYVLLSLFKGWDNNLSMEVKMSNPTVTNILIGVILFVVVMKLIDRLQTIYFKSKARKRIFINQKNKKIQIELSSAHSLSFKMKENTDKRNKMIVWIYDTSSHRFTPLYNTGFLENNMTYETGLLLIHPDDRGMYINDLHLLTSGIQDRISTLLRFYCNGRYEMFRYNAIAIKSVTTGKVDKIIGTEECISWYAHRFPPPDIYPSYANRHRG